MRKSPKRKKLLRKKSTRKNKARRNIKKKSKVRKIKSRRNIKKKSKVRKRSKSPKKYLRNKNKGMVPTKFNSRFSVRTRRASKFSSKPIHKILSTVKTSTMTSPMTSPDIWTILLWNRPNYYRTAVSELFRMIRSKPDLIFLQEVKRDFTGIYPIQMLTRSFDNKPFNTIHNGTFKNYNYKMICAYGRDEKLTKLNIYTGKPTRIYSNELCQNSLVKKENEIMETATIDLNSYWKSLFRKKTGGKKFRYIRLVLGVKVKKNYRELWCWNLHFPHSHIVELTEELINRISSKYSNSKHIILGDFNKDPEFAIPEGWSFHYTKKFATHNEYIKCGITPYKKGTTSVYDYMITNIVGADIKVKHIGRGLSGYSERSDHCPIKITLDFSNQINSSIFS